MFVIDEAKLPPPTPASAATNSIVPNDVFGSETANASATHGTTRTSADTIVQFRPPNFGTANVYGSRSVAPTRFGIATSQNSWLSVNANPTLFRLTATMLQITQTEKPRCSAKIDRMRLRRAIRLPVDAQNSGSSGS